MAKQAKLKAVLSLDNSQFTRSIKQSIQFAKDLARQFKAQPIRTTFLAGILGARAGIKATASALQGVVRVAGEALKVGSVVGATLALAMTGISVKAIEAAAQVEDLTVSFKVLLGSADAAGARMKELVNFAAHTPFMLPQVAAASRTLEVLTHGMLSTGKGLEMVGDIASATNRDFQETAVTVGRLFAALRSGQHPGEALASLQDSGAISPEARQRISGMASVSPLKAWQLAQQELSRFSGMMEQKSRTWNGLMSTFHDSVLNAFAVFGKPLIDTLKPTLDQLTQVGVAAAPKIAEMGTKFAAGIQVAIGALEEGFLHPDTLINPLKLGLKAAFYEAGNVLIAAVKTAASLIPDIASGLAGAFVGLQQIISGSLMQAFATPIAWLTAEIQQKMEQANQLLHPDPNKIADESYRRAAIRDKAAAEKRGDTQEAARQQGLIDKYGKSVNGPTVAERAQRLINASDIAETGRGQVAAGQQTLAAEVKASFKAMSEAAKAFKVEDVTGAGNVMSEFLEAMKKLAEKGKRDVEAIVRAQKAASTSPAAIRDTRNAASIAAARSGGALGGSDSSWIFSKNKGSLPTLGTMSGMHGATLAQQGPAFYGPGGGRAPLVPSAANGLIGSMLDAPVKRTVDSLLPIGMRKKNARFARIAEDAASFMTNGKFDTSKGGLEGFAGSVRRGDRAAARQFIIGKEKEQVEQDRQKASADAFRNAFDQGMAKYWGKGS